MSDPNGYDLRSRPELIEEARRVVDDLKAARKEHDLLTRLMQVVGKYLRSHGRGVFCDTLLLRGLPVERFPRWETPPFSEKDKAELKEGLEKAGFTA